MARPRVITDAELEEMAALYRKGLSIRQVGVRYGVTYTAMHRRLRVAGVTFREPTGGRRKRRDSA